MFKCDVHEEPNRPQGGFALAIVLLALLAFTVLASAGYLLSNTDYRITQNHRAAMRAFYVSDAARSQYMGRGKLRNDTVTYTYTDGRAEVWTAPLIAVDDSTTLYRLVSLGQHRSPEGGVATRTTSSVVAHKAVGIAVNAAITAPAGLVKNGVAGTVSGADAASAADCPVGGTEDVAGLQVPPGGFTDNGASKKGKGGFYGNPAIDSTSTTSKILDDLGIDWQGMLDGSFAEADYVVSEDGYPSFASDVAADEWPFIDNSYSGRGTLVIEGNAKFNGDFAWEGVILIGGQLVSDGNQSIQGAIVAGLNLKRGGTPNATDLGNGTWSVAYHSCNILNALKGLGWPVEEPGTWHEVF
jgi:hypothetical protein